MFVASSVECGDEGRGVVALLPQIVGNIETAIGCGTLWRGNGIAAQVRAGDPVCRGDVIETAADGRIGIRFIDGTVFNLSGGKRVALDEFACHPGGTSRSPPFAASRGIFGFIAGRVAKAARLGGETPVGSIRARAHGGGIGTLLLAALGFSIIKEAQAADSNATFLDDDNIAYKDMAHGAFSLVTKEAIPRHIIVADPGETIILSPRGSSISVNQVTNSAARMAELQEAQQDVLANFAKGLGPNGSSTPPFVNELPVQPINFIQNDTPSAQDPLPPLPIHVVPETLILRPPPPPPSPPTLTIANGPTEIDTVAFDTFTATSGTFAASSSNSGAILTYGISGGIAGNTVLGGVTYDVSDTGPYGTLYVSSTTGAYSFVPNSGAINALTAPTTESFLITVSDGTLSASQAFTINIDGVNDAAIISGTVAGSVTDAGSAPPGTPGAPGGASPGTLTATGTLTDTDVDNTPNTFTAVSSPTASTGGHGTFTITSAGVWTYTLNHADSAVRALNVGDTLTDSFTVTTIDGTPQMVTVTIHGSNDAAIIHGTTTGSVIEAGDDQPGQPTATGTLTDTDVDNTPNTFTAVSSPTASAGGHGTFTITPAGVWTYTLDNADSAVQALNVGDTLTDSFTVTTIDGTPQVVTVTIHGSNDAAIIHGTTTGKVIEAGSDEPGQPTATGTLTDTDVDNTPNTFTAVSSPTASAGGHGTFTMTAAGVWTYTLDNADGAVQALNVGDTLTDSFTVTTIDGTPQVVTVTIHGSNDAAVISGTTTGSVIEAACDKPGQPTAHGTLTDTDVDNTPNTFTPVGSPAASDAGYGTFTMTEAGVWTYTLDNDNHAVQALNVGDTLTDSFTVTTVDGTPQVVTVTIHGSNDAAIIHGTITGKVIEAGDDRPGQPTATGTLTDTDVDNAPNTFTPVGSPAASDAGYGIFTMTEAGVWTYTLDNANHAVQALNVGDTLTDSFTVTTVDGTPQVVTVTIHGSNDAAIIHGTTTGSVIEAGDDGPGQPTAHGTLTDTDVDNTPNTFTPVGSPAASDAGYGTFTMTEAGVWTYTLDNANHAVQALNVGDMLTDSFTVTTVDGTPQVVTVTIHGTNDAAIIHGTTTGSVIEAGCDGPGQPTAHGTLTDTDVDNAPNTFTPVGSPAASDAGYGAFTMTEAGVWTYTLDNANHAVQALNVGDTLTDSFRVTTVDGTPQVLTVTIHGSNDAAIIHGATTGSVIEPSDDGPGQPTAHGTLTDTDVDNTPNTFTPVGSPAASEAGYGTFTMTADGVWTYTLDDANHAVRELDADDTLTDSFRVTTVDGTPQVITITIHGSDDDWDDDGRDAHDFQPSSIAHVVFGSTDTLGLGDSFHFNDQISGLAGADATNLADGGHTPASISDAAAGTGGSPAVSGGAQTIEPALPGQHSVDQSGIVPDHAGGAVVTHVAHDLVV